MSDDPLRTVREHLNLPIGEIETVFVDDRAVVVRGKLIGPLPELGCDHVQPPRPYLLGKPR